jgi:hypothetical protein
MTERSTVTEYLALLRHRAGPERDAAWVDVYEAAHPEIFAVYYSAWGDRAAVPTAAGLVEAQAAAVRRRERQTSRAVATVSRRLRRLGLADLDIPLVMLVGGHSANGWVADLEGEPALFIALEHLDDSPGDVVLAAHEAAHVVHRRLSPTFDTGAFTGRLVAEGVALAVSRMVVTDASDSECFWFDQAHPGWTADCRAARHRIAALVRGAETGADRELESLFDLRPAPGVPPRAGYWLADQVIGRRASTPDAAREVMTWTDAEALAHVERVSDELFSAWEDGAG